MTTAVLRGGCAGRWPPAAATTTTTATDHAPATTAAGRRRRGHDGRRRPTADGTTAPGSTAAAGPATRAAQRRGGGLRRGQDARGRSSSTVATGEPAFPPYVIDDDPENGQGFEAAVAYAVAGAMGFGPDAGDVDPHAVRGGHPARPEGLRLQPPAVLDHPRARGGRQLQPAVLRRQPGHPRLRRLARRRRAETITDFQDLKIGVAAGTTSLDFVTDVLQPTERPVRLQRQRGGQAGARHQADRRHRRRPADGAVHHAPSRSRAPRCSASSPPSRAARASRGACSSPRTTRSSSASTWPSRRSRDAGTLDAITERVDVRRARRPRDRAGVIGAARRRPVDAHPAPALRATPAAPQHRHRRRQHGGRRRPAASGWCPKTSGWESVQQSFFNPEVFR